MRKSIKFRSIFKNALAYLVLTFFAFLMVFPFLVMFFTSLKEVGDTYNYPPRLLPRKQQTQEVAGYAEPLPVYYIEQDGLKKQFVLVDRSVKVGEFSEPDKLDVVYTLEMDQVHALAEMGLALRY